MNAFQPLPRWLEHGLDKRHKQINQLQCCIDLENRDAEYAARARIHGVDYDAHVDGFCQYWQNLRARKFLVVNFCCEDCGEPFPLECHHDDYETLGFEELEDVSALCRECHEDRHDLDDVA